MNHQLESLLQTPSRIHMNSGVGHGTRFHLALTYRPGAGPSEAMVDWSGFRVFTHPQSQVYHEYSIGIQKIHNQSNNKD